MRNFVSDGCVRIWLPRVRLTPPVALDGCEAVCDAAVVWGDLVDGHVCFVECVSDGSKRVWSWTRWDTFHKSRAYIRPLERSKSGNGLRAQLGECGG